MSVTTRLESDSSFNKPAYTDDDDDDPLEDVRMQQFKIGVTMRLLENFCLEETIDHYRNLSSAKFRMNPSDFSIQCSGQASRARTRLLNLMGTDDVHMSDVPYMKALRQKIWQEYEAQMEKDELVRAQAERDRLRRLMVEGVISVDDLRGDVCMMREYRKLQAKLKKQAEAEQGKAAVDKLKARFKSSASPKKKFLKAEEEQLLWNVKEGRMTPVDGIVGSSRVASPQVYLSREPSPLAGNIFAQSPYDSVAGSRAASSAGLYTKRMPSWFIYEHPIVIEMRHEQSVQRLYELAQELHPHVHALHRKGSVADLPKTSSTELADRPTRRGGAKAK